MNTKTLILSGAAFAAVSVAAQAGVLVGYDFGTPSANTSAPTVLDSSLSITTALDGVGGANAFATQYTIGDNTGVAASGTTFGSLEAGNFGGTSEGLTGASGANGGNTLAGAIFSDDYITFAFAADTAGTLNLSGFSIDTARANNLTRTAQNYNILAQVDGGNTWEVAGALTTDQTIDVIQGLTEFDGTFIDLSVASSFGTTFQNISSVEFRVYLWGGSGTASTSRVNYDQIVVEGTVIPESGTYALLAGCFALASVMVRRRGA